ncbi:GNAT family N-acetyltransferase [Pleurocapsales cyanobacterium LEGE 06147]|nr:GNAT family N-acetyltransferase [Pleurocapsales cyanobacterium LEGE 06147]
MAREIEARKIAEIHVASWQTAFQNILPESVLTSVSVPEWEKKWKQILSADRSTTLVLEQEDDNIVGIVSHSSTRDKDKDPSITGEVSALYLLPKFWGKGFGKELLKEALERLDTSGFKEMTLWVLEINWQARTFYERMAFQADGTTKIKRKAGIDLHKLRYRKSLA